ncbi:uncharacterized protein [Haliotis cracherodii]|uniref:uncharacterized protein n=1 Tax=Haliotis cracherodii TaxID=6455 RepID=UPI0039EC2021
MAYKLDLLLETVESTLKVVLEQISETNNRCQALEEENFRLKDQMKAMDDKLDYLENMSRRNNLIFHGVPRGNETESWTDCELIVKNVLRNDLQLLDDVNIQRAHRIMKGKAIIVKLADDKDKHAILRASKALKDTGMFITEDFSPLVRQKRKKLLPKMFQARESGLKAFLRYDKLYTEDNIYSYDLGLDCVTTVKSGHKPGLSREVSASDDVISSPGLS